MRFDSILISNILYKILWKITPFVFHTMIYISLTCSLINIKIPNVLPTYFKMSEQSRVSTFPENNSGSFTLLVRKYC